MELPDNLDMRFIAKTLHGLEQVLADEMQALGMKSVNPGRRLVSFSGDLEDLYKRCNGSFHRTRMETG